MNAEFEKYYNQGIAFKQEGKHSLSAEAHIKALEFFEDFAEGWHNAGAALLRIQKTQEAEPYLLRALNEYQKRLDEDENTAYNLFWKSCVYALLHQKEAMLQTLQEAIQHNPVYAEEAPEEEDFAEFLQDEDFIALIEEELKALELLHYRGKSLSMEELTPEDLEDRILFVQTLQKAGWDTQQIESYIQAGLSVSPQAMGEYCDNPDFCIRLSYHIDESLLFMELLNQHNEEVQAYRLYFKKSIHPIVAEVIAFQNILSPDNWMNLIKKLIPLCKDLLYELPNGVKVKLGKL
ncbi:MAG: tetratricopeptide repeat protein [Microscillaceae bacterium]|nr:tetratricopeptide repeat protein [Microscillaceae bacterium]